jgi:epoxyqueuosine reductase QueG
MNIETIIRYANDFVNNSVYNTVPQSTALKPDISGMRIFDEPIIGCVSPNDTYFEMLKMPEARLMDFKPPLDWLATAKTVISFFLPFTTRVKESNTINMAWPSEEWMNARIEGQDFIRQLSKHLCETLSAAGYATITPATDPGFWSKPLPPLGYTSNWSERHIAYACGLGTFSLSKGLITALGVAGRLGSVITELELPPTPRPYSGLYDYCSRCGICAEHCPSGAISLETGKDYFKCKRFLDETRKPKPPYYGCGKCQVGVPCESAINRDMKHY